MPANPKPGLGGILTGLLSNPVTRTIAKPILDAALPAARKAIGRRPLVIIGATSAGAAATVQYLGRAGVVIPESIATPLGIGIMLAGVLAAQATVTPVATPHLTPAQHAKAVIVAAPKAAAKAAKGAKK